MPCRSHACEPGRSPAHLCHCRRQRRHREDGVRRDYAAGSELMSELRSPPIIVADTRKVQHQLTRVAAGQQQAPHKRWPGKRARERCWHPHRRWASIYTEGAAVITAVGASSGVVTRLRCRDKDTPAAIREDCSLKSGAAQQGARESAHPRCLLHTARSPQAGPALTTHNARPGASPARWTARIENLSKHKM